MTGTVTNRWAVPSAVFMNKNPDSDMDFGYIIFDGASPPPDLGTYVTCGFALKSDVTHLEFKSNIIRTLTTFGETNANYMSPNGFVFLHVWNVLSISGDTKIEHLYLFTPALLQTVMSSGDSNPAPRLFCCKHVQGGFVFAVSFSTSCTWYFANPYYLTTLHYISEDGCLVTDGSGFVEVLDDRDEYPVSFWQDLKYMLANDQDPPIACQLCMLCLPITYLPWLEDNWQSVRAQITVSRITTALPFFKKPSKTTLFGYWLGANSKICGTTSYADTGYIDADLFVMHNSGEQIVGLTYSGLEADRPS